MSERSEPLKLSRREVLAAALALPAIRLRLGAPSDALRSARGFVVGAGDADVSKVELTRTWDGDVCRSRVTNHGSVAVAIKEIVLFDVALDLPSTTPIYGESFQMLSQTGGTLGAPRDLGSYSDATHYKIPSPPGTKTMFGAMTMTPKAGEVISLGFTSTRRFAGMFRLQMPSSLQVSVDAEGLPLGTGESWDLEEFTTARDASHDLALAAIGTRLARNHPPPRTRYPPTGWCSWYCFGPRVTAQNILDNLDAIAKKIPLLRYVQIDDGYQPAMGDWLETGAAFGGEVRKVLDEIKRRRFEPAIWVAPFVAEEQSHVFQQHREWFVKDATGAPLRSDTVTFGGWRHGPWYVLDGTHPEVQGHFRTVFDAMHREWGVTYFKLDANFWGAIHGGRFHDPKATRIEAYRRGMTAIRRGAGDSFILGCNHPIWASAGLIDGSRSSNDIRRSWDRLKSTAQQNLLRNWQNGRLWWNDPDAICLSGDLPENEYVFHATAIYASGGMLLSGDDLTTLPEPRLAMLKKLIPPTGVAATFDDDTLQIGIVRLRDKTMFCCFNWADTALSLTRRLEKTARVTDFWTGASLGRVAQFVVDVPPHSARLLEAVDV